jgi:hypothetical protein
MAGGTVAVFRAHLKREAKTATFKFSGIISILLDVSIFISDRVRWAQVGKVIKKIVVRPHAIFRHLSVGENCEEKIRDVVREPAAVGREGRGACGVIAQNVWQQLCSYHLLALA